jgi:hypothetical protein
MYLNIIKDKLNKPTANIILSEEKHESSFFNIWDKARLPTVTILVNVVLEALLKEIRKDE